MLLLLLQNYDPRVRPRAANFTHGWWNERLEYNLQKANAGLPGGGPVRVSVDIMMRMLSKIVKNNF
jgi:hypothetical protein